MSEGKLLYADETCAIRGAAFEVCKEMGDAFDENAYQECMEIALKERGVEFGPFDRLQDVSEGFNREICPLVQAPGSVFFARRAKNGVASETGCVSGFPCRKS